MKKLFCVFAALSLTASLALAAPAAGSTTTTTTTKPTTATATTKTTTATTTTKPATATATTKPTTATAATKPATTKPATATKPAATVKTIKPYVDAGDTVVNAGIGYAGYYGGYGLAAGIEFDFVKINAGVLPITFGVSARGAFEFGGYVDTVWCAGAMATAHLGLRGVKIATNYGWASNFDTYVGIGLGIAGGSDTYWPVTPKIGPAIIVGETYYFDDKLGANFEYGYLGRYSYSYYGSYNESAYYASLGLVYKL